MKTCLALFGLAALSLTPIGCQTGGKAPKSVGAIEKVVDSPTENRLLAVRPLGGGRFLSLRGGEEPTSTKLYIEEKAGPRLLYAPPDTATIAELGDIREGKVTLAVTEPMDLAESSKSLVTWVGLDVRTESELFESPFEDEGGKPIPVTYAGAAHPIFLRELPGGGFCALIASREGVALQTYNGLGEKTRAISVVPSVPGSPRASLPGGSGFLEVTPTGDFIVVTTLYAGEVAALERSSGQALHSKVSDPLSQLVVILGLTPAGRVSFSSTVDLGPQSADVTAVALKDDLLLIAGDYQTKKGSGKAYAAIVRLSGSGVRERKYVLYDVSTDNDLAAGIAYVPGHGILVAGNSGLVQVPTRSIVAHGSPFLSLLDENGREIAFQQVDSPALQALADVFVTDGIAYLVGHANPPMTHGSGKDLTTAIFELRMD